MTKVQNTHIPTRYSGDWIAQCLRAWALVPDYLGPSPDYASHQRCITSQSICSASVRGNNSARLGGWWRIRWDKVYKALNIVPTHGESPINVNCFINTLDLPIGCGSSALPSSNSPLSPRPSPPQSLLSRDLLHTQWLPTKRSGRGLARIVRISNDRSAETKLGSEG